MTTLVAVPIFRVSCKVGIDKGRAWSVVEELVLWAMARKPRSIGALAAESGLPDQVIVAAIARLMRFRLVNVVPVEGGVAFRGSDYGFKAISSGNPLPFFAKRYSKRVSFVVERATGQFFLTREVRPMSRYKLDQQRRAGADVRFVVVEEDGVPISHEANFNRLSDVVARGWDEQIAFVDGHTASLRDDEFMLIRIVDGIPRGVPEDAGPDLEALIAEAAALPVGEKTLSVSYSGPRETVEPGPLYRPCRFEANDLIIGGSAQREVLLGLLETAHSRVIIHSTFLEVSRFQEMLDVVRTACRRGVTFDILWGAEFDDDTESRNANAAARIMECVRQEPDTSRRVRVHMRSTGSHAKLLLADTSNGDWIGVVGSCNWLSSPFQAVEVSVVLRDPAIVADVAVALQQIAGRRGLSDSIANEMAIVARDLRTLSSPGGTARIAILSGDAHDRMMREASGAAQSRFVVGSHRLGSTARPGAIMPGEVAAGRPGVNATVLYTRTSGPLKNRHARDLAEEAGGNGVRLLKADKVPLHGKFVAWDQHDLIVTSLNWASAAVSPDFPHGDIGVHIQMPGIAETALQKLEEIFPQLSETAGT